MMGRKKERKQEMMGRKNDKYSRVAFGAIMKLKT